MPVNTSWPSVVEDFTKFLIDAGLQFQARKEGEAFGDKLLQFGGQHVNIRIVIDRGIGYVEVADAVHHSNEWYDSAILRDLLLGYGEDVLPSLEKQTEIIEANWPNLVDLFSPGKEEHTHARLAILRTQRAKRRFPNRL